MNVKHNLKFIDVRLYANDEIFIMNIKMAIRTNAFKSLLSFRLFP